MVVVEIGRGRIGRALVDLGQCDSEGTRPEWREEEEP